VFAGHLSAMGEKKSRLRMAHDRSRSLNCFVASVEIERLLFGWYVVLKSYLSVGKYLFIGDHSTKNQTQLAYFLG
jgi:hypothetical protein